MIQEKIKIESQEKTEKKEIPKTSLSNDSRLVNNNIINPNPNQTIKKEIKHQALINKDQNNSKENNNININNIKSIEKEN